MNHPAIQLLTSTLESYYLQSGTMPPYVVLHPENLFAIAQVMGQTAQLKNNKYVLQVNADVMLLADDNCLKGQMRPMHQIQQEAAENLA